MQAPILELRAQVEAELEQNPVLEETLTGEMEPVEKGAKEKEEVAEQAVSPFQGIDLHIIGGAGGRLHQTRDYWFGDIRRPFAEGGMWGIIRVVSDSKCPIKALDTRTCVGTPGP